MEDAREFGFDIPLSFFEKADADPGKEKRIGGIASIETKDRQDETVLQRGLDFSEFYDAGWFNDNHSKKTADILGIPDKRPEFFRKGQKLPNGEAAKASGWWVEGYLLNTPKATEVWELGKALQKTKRRLGFSVEGKVLQRTGPNMRTIASAIVRNVAITNCPVNTAAKMEVLAKSLRAAEDDEDKTLEKMLGMGPVAVGAGGAPVPPASMGPQTGMGAGRIIAKQSLESNQTPPKKLKKKKRMNKALSDIEAFRWLRARLPNATSGQLGRLITLTRELKEAGQL